MEYLNGSVKENLKFQFNKAELNLSRIANTASSLADAHLDLLSEEMGVQTKRGTGGIAFLISGLLAGTIAAIFFSVAFAQLLAEKVDGISLSGGLAIVAGIWVVAAPLLAYSGMRKMEKVTLVPRATLESIKETISCLRN